jgi:2-phospho-L-lactate/phosphoenolpyruvate guanylyltransferase
VGVNLLPATRALVPLKSGERAKSRLAAVLSPEQRLRLFYAMAGRVIRTLHECRSIASVAVVTAGAQVAGFARDLGATPVVQSADLGVSAALSSALETMRSDGSERVLMLPGDLPLITHAAVEEILSAWSGPGIVIVPDRHHAGTNALLCTPPNVIAPCFGDRSFERHIAAACAAGVHVRTLELPDLALDLDCPEDLELLRRHQDAPAAELMQVLRVSETSRVVAG